jgi:hypothetical protein
MGGIRCNNRTIDLGECPCEALYSFNIFATFGRSFLCSDLLFKVKESSFHFSAVVFLGKRRHGDICNGRDGPGPLHLQILT